MKHFMALSLAITYLCAVVPNGVSEEPGSEVRSKVVMASEVEWKPLNPLRGNKGPQAGTLWGDQTGTGASGFLVKFVDGFSSPPHIHNITYRGVVISGGLFNGDPKGEPMWMRVGSYWTQPVGQPHITAARGPSVAYVEIQEGPYLVLPTEKATDNGERPINLDASNIVWLDASSTSWIDQPAQASSAVGPEIAFLWGKPQKDQISGTLVKLPAGFTGMIQTPDSTFRAVVIQGQPQVKASGLADAKTMAPGSYFSSQEKAEHQIACEAEDGCMIYVRTKGKFNILQSTQPGSD
ncbi:DUF4437 domain-containing protein [Symmachiella dynata]|uniref:DUF4437 domain-containing protein n=1 Tax=Symmachiella dynata TaxID=2527995 RepID=UPI00118B11DB|nr:DUF4437 domain-containing protein [Symmachiella dynata]QDT48674.1 hypothetical protein Pan258_27170 [Symmachiella dynata]